MSASLLSHAFGLQGYDYVKTDYQGGAVASPSGSGRAPTAAPCATPGRSAPEAPRSGPSRRPPIGGKPVRVFLAIPRVERPSRKVPLAFAPPRRGHGAGLRALRPGAEPPG
jgi:transposase